MRHDETTMLPLEGRQPLQVCHARKIPTRGGVRLNEHKAKGIRVEPVELAIIHPPFCQPRLMQSLCTGVQFYSVQERKAQCRRLVAPQEKI